MMTVGSLALEGGRSALLGCSLVLVVPAMFVGFIARRCPVMAVLVFWVAVSLGAFARFSGLRGAGVPGARVFGVGVPAMTDGVALLVGIIGLGLLIGSRRVRWPGAVVGPLLIGWASSSSWEPCVGAHFGTLLNDLDRSPVLALALLAVYVLGVLTPALTVGAVHQALSVQTGANVVGDDVGGS